MTQAVKLAQIGSPGVSTGFKNRIINGAMVIDQRNAGAAITTAASGTFGVDRFKYESSPAAKFTIQQNAGSVTPPVGFKNYLGFTTTSAYSVSAGDLFYVTQQIEGYNVADLAWGTANAKTVTLSFQVYSSLTGTFGGAISNSAQNRSYPFSYTISSANTWTSISVTIAGDTTGTWLTTNGTGMYVFWSLGTGTTYSGTAGAWAGTQYVSATGATSVVATNGATFYITGVQLEVGTTATDFEYRDYGRELMMCQRYYEKSYDIGDVAGSSTVIGQFNSGGVQGTTTTSEVNGSSPQFAVAKRATPSVTVYDPTGNSGKVNRVQYGVTNNQNSTAAVNDIGQNRFTVISSSGATAGGLIYHWVASAEL